MEIGQTITVIGEIHCHLYYSSTTGAVLVCVCVGGGGGADGEK